MPHQTRHATAKLFTTGGSQAVRLPKEFRFDDVTEVRIRREGGKVILEPLETWSPRFVALLGSVDEELDRPGSRPIREVKNPWG